MPKGREYFEGETVMIIACSGDGDVPGSVVRPFAIGTVIGYTEMPRGRHIVEVDDGVEYSVYDDGRLMDHRDPCLPSHGDWVDGEFALQRVNPEELGAEFPEKLRGEIDSVSQLAQGSNTFGRAAVLATLRNLRSYLEQGR